MINITVPRGSVPPLYVVGLVVWLLGVAVAWTSFGPLVGAAATIGGPMIVGIVLAPWVRLLVVIGGGLFVLGSTSDVSPAKLIYSALVVLCLVAAGLRMLVQPPRWAIDFLPMLPAGVVLLTILVVGSVVGGATSPQELGRQAIFYLLIVGAPVLGLDAARQVPPRWVAAIICIAGLLSAFGFAADWLDRRGVSSLGFGRFVVSGLMLPAFAFAFAIVSLAFGRGLIRRLPWLLSVVLIPVAMLIPGTRTNLVLAMAFVGEFGSSRLKRLSPARALLLIAVCGGLIAVVFPLFAGAVVSQPDFLQKRIDLLFNFFDGDTGTDGSYQQRTEQYQTATSLIQQHPLFGVGVGFALNLVLDTPLASPARIGILGVAAVVVFVGTLALCIRRVARRHGPAVPITAFWGFLLVSLSALPFGTPLDDRTYGFTLTLIILAVASRLAHARSNEFHEVDETSVGQPNRAVTKTSAKRSGV